MKYAIIGSGNIGSAIARHFARQGMDVAIANTRGPESLFALKKEIGDRVMPQSLEDASKADMVILAAPYSAIAGIAASARNWAGKIVVDASNAIDFPSFKPTDLGGRPSSELVARQLRGARVVKAFNTLPAAVLASDPRVGSGRRVLFMSGDDPEAVAAVAAVAEKFGFAPIILGKLGEGGLLQQFGGPLVIQNFIKLA